MLQLNRWLRIICWSFTGVITLLPGCKSETTGDGTKDAGADIVTLDVLLQEDLPVADSAPDRVPSAGETAPDRGPGTPDAQPCRHELDNPSCWASRQGSKDVTLSYNGAVFDGKYINFLSASSSSSILRYDPSKPFEDSKSWSGLDASSRATYVSSGAFDGRYLYLISQSARYNGAGGSTYDDLMARLDTQAASPTAASAWASLDVTKCNGTADVTVPGYVGGTFDGRYMYFAPINDGNGASGKVMRYDAQASFTDASAWSWFDMSIVTTNAKGFQGAVFDGSYVYFVPSAYMIDMVNGDSTPSGIVMRYDPKGVFTDAAAWSYFDTGTLTPSSRGFSGATFDGRYIYLVPDPDLYKDVIAVRYDTKSAFTDGGSWQSYNLSNSTSQGGIGLRDVYFKGGTFDGRYVYYSPGDSSTVLRYDSQSGFTSTSAWSTFATAIVGADTQGFRGTTFDGRYVYFVSSGWGPMMRFDAVTPAALPPGYGASYY